MKSPNFAHQALATFGTQMIVFGFATAIGILVTRILGPEQKGLYFLAFSLAFLLIIILKSSIEVAGTYLTGRKAYEVRQLPFHYLIAAFGSSLVAFSVLAFFWAPLKAKFFTELPEQFAIVAFLAVPFYMLIFYLVTIFMIRKDVRTYNRVFILHNILNSLFLLLFTIVFQWGALGALAAWTAGTIVTSLYTYWRIHVDIQPVYRYDPKFMRELYGYGLKGHIGEIVDFLINRTDTFLVNFFLGVGAVGLYSVALSAELLWYIPNSIVALLFPKLSHEPEKAVELTATVCRITVFLTIVPMIILMLMGKLLISVLFGAAFAGAALPFIILLPGIASLSISKTLKALLSSDGHPLVATYASILAFCLNLLLNFILIPHYGLVGAAVAVSASYAVYAVAILIQFMRLYPVTLSNLLIIKAQDFYEVRDMLGKKDQAGT